MKLYKGLACPLDGYEIVLFSLTGPDAKTYPLCPFCYNNPPAGAQQVCTLSKQTSWRGCAPCDRQILLLHRGHQISMLKMLEMCVW